MVFQRFDLFPHMTASGNVTEAPVQVKGMTKRDARRLAEVLGVMRTLASEGPP